MQTIIRSIALILLGAAITTVLHQWRNYGSPWQHQPASAFENASHSQTVCEATSKSSIVYVNLGPSFEYQNYIWISIRQARLFNPCTPIFLICSLEALSTADIQDEIASCRVQTVDYASLTNELLTMFRQKFFVQGAMNPDGNVKFNQYTSERLLAVWALMDKFRLQNVIHLENDNMLYSSASDLVFAMQTCDVHLAVPFPSVGIAVVGIAYIRDADALEPFIRFVMRVFAMQPSEAVDYLGTEYVNDMSLLGKFYRENTLSKLVAELPSKIYEGRARQLNGSQEGQFLEPLTFREDHPHSCIAEALPATIFDSCVLGQFYGGAFGQPGNQWWEDRRQFDPRGKQLWWRVAQVDNREIRLPYVDELRIHNLHVHSKLLQNFAS